MGVGKKDAELTDCEREAWAEQTKIEDWLARKETVWVWTKTVHTVDQNRALC